MGQGNRACSRNCRIALILKVSENPQNPDVVIPVIQEEVQADAVPVVTGGVRVTKHVETQDQILEQQLRTSHAEVKRVKTNRIVDGPQSPQRVGDTLIIPVVSEVLRVHKEWVVTEEIHITESKELETVQQTVPVAHEEAHIERLDESGNAATVADVPAEPERTHLRDSGSLLRRPSSAASTVERPLRSNSSSLLAGKKPGPRKTKQ
jgi:stress response protein YsnF